jgi:hypothetical protein
MYDNPELNDQNSRSLIAEIATIKNVDDKSAKEFIDFSTFDEIFDCLKSGDSIFANLNPEYLALLFCHISTDYYA